MSNCNPKPIPCDLTVAKVISDDSPELTDCKLYREMVGSLIYLMTVTRPDISYVVTKLSQFLSKPTKAHLNLAKHVMKYLKGTIHYDLKFKKCANLSLIGYSDSDWASSNDRFSISGYCFMLNDNGPLISWKTKKQNVVALSSCEAEYVALTYTVKEAKFLRQLYSDMLCNDRDRVTVFGDNQGAIALAYNPINHQRSKHIDIRYHFIRHEIHNDVIDLKYICTDDNTADMFTKPLSKNKLNHFSYIRG